MQDHVKKIEEKISWHRGEMERLQTALDVIRSLDAPGEAPSASRAASPKKPSPKGNAKAAAASATSAKKKGMPGAEVRKAVEDIITKADKPLTSAEVAKMIGMDDNKQPVYQALYSMRTAGRAAKDDEGRYTPVAAS